ncbi:hypothetical protein O6P37_14505 [Mycobacterium sp. CPCC 205372]|uniref:Uncharacterized protein n=1 Tax=Mycobacterium hippophais TaxID=3016340 RepID=A0ABT4PU44_9MYCO|nr:hypothetical protein [Mycobacterium hippophais]MCZ8380081.1 hypothetical protein [Mycobacterium hippophais]
MAGIDHEALAAAMPWETEPFTILEPGEQTRAATPQAWWPIVESSDPQDRRQAALALWNDDFLSLIPNFAQALHDDLVDVRVVAHPWIGAASLDYVVAASAGEGYGVWMGEDPATFGDDDPPLFDSLPPPVQTFLRRVHAGFTTWDRESCGLTPPSIMNTLAAYWGDPEDSARIEWYETEAEAPEMRRLLRVTGRGPHGDLLTSPDLPADSAVTYFEPDFELKPFGESLDLFMTMPLEE